MSIKLKKTLYVGIGGTGTDTLLEVKKCFIDSYGEIPPMIGFLVVDTDGAATNKSRTSSKGERIELLPSELLVCTVSGALNVYRANTHEYNWVPKNNVNSLAYIAGGGAGQVRSNGHFIAYYNRNQIQNAINSAILRINAPLPINSKYQVDMNETGMAYPININVVTSIAGGTGSGMLIDILCIIHSTAQQQHKLYPWIVLPEVFRAMNAGPSMFNVLYNSYGALRELDYIMHYNSNERPINLGNTQINDQLIDFAYLINNSNLNGTSFNSIDDLTEVIAKSMFLPANEMGDAVRTPFDNIMVQSAAGTYNIRGKKAWAATASSAELLYDGQAVGRAFAYRTIWQLCDSMMRSPADGTNDANIFVDTVKIQEHLRDDVIDSLLSKDPLYVLQIDENTTINDITAYLDANREPSLQDQLQNNLMNKYDAATKGFTEMIETIMSRSEGKVGATIQFIGALQDILDICKNEMTEEKAVFRKKNEVPMQWDVELNAVRPSGIASLFRKTDRDQVDKLQYDLRTAAINIREEIRRDWALQFYTQFDDVINKKLTQLQGLKSTIEQISDDCRGKLVAEQQRAQADTLFQIFLHKEDVMSVSNFEINDNIKADFLTFLGKKGTSPWISMTKDQIKKELWNFAKETHAVMNAVNTTIDEVLQKMPQNKIEIYLNRIKNMASPLWTYNTQGYVSQASELDRFIVVGVGNRNTSILSTNPAYNKFFDLPAHNASFASTNQNDRVYILVVEDLLPVYAVNNFKAYEDDHQQKISDNIRMVNYIDETLNKRIKDENFNVTPIQDDSDILKYWVYGFVFGYINYDDNTNTYWIRSRKKGDALKKYRYDLGSQRDIAYATFKSGQFYIEIKNSLDNEIAHNGISAIENKIQEINDNDSYLDEVSQLSPLEKNNLDNPNFQSVHDLVVKEINCITAN